MRGAMNMQMSSASTQAAQRSIHPLWIYTWFVLKRIKHTTYTHKQH